MRLFSRVLGETTEKKMERWQQELLKMLPRVLSEEDAFNLIEEESVIVIRRGSAHVFVAFGVNEDNEDNDSYVVIYSPLVVLPRENLLPFYRKLLDLNNREGLLGRLATEGNEIILRSTIPMEGLSEKSFYTYVFTLMEEADILDDQLIGEFHTKRVEF